MGGKWLEKAAATTEAQIPAAYALNQVQHSPQATAQISASARLRATKYSTIINFDRPASGRLGYVPTSLPVRKMIGRKSQRKKAQKTRLCVGVYCNHIFMPLRAARKWKKFPCRAASSCSSRPYNRRPCHSALFQPFWQWLSCLSYRVGCRAKSVGAAQLEKR